MRWHKLPRVASLRRNYRLWVEARLGKKVTVSWFLVSNGRRGLFGSGWVHKFVISTILNSNAVKIEKMIPFLSNWQIKKNKKKTHTLTKWAPS